MMPTPNLYLDEGHDRYKDLPHSLKSTEVRLFYITDRVPEDDEEGNLRYGYGRSPSLAFGTAVVDLGVGITWEELLEASRTRSRPKKAVLKLGVIEEIFRGPNLPIPFKEVNGRIIEKPNRLAQSKIAQET